jgi:tetratricopeptide (TPR) repeat protein
MFMGDTMNKGVKTPEEWKNVIGELSPKIFEYLCYELVKSMPGFVSVDLRDGSYDSGRDIDATYRGKAPDGITEIAETWRFECKKYSNGIPFDDISGKINQASLKRIDKLVIMSNMHLTPACKDGISDVQNTLNCNVFDWTGVHFQDILFQYPDICKEYFPDEELPQRFLDTKRPQELINVAQRAGSHFGIKLEIKLKEGQKPPTSTDEVVDVIKETLLNLKDVDLNIKSLIYQQLSGLFLSIDRKEDALLFIDESLEITPNNVAALLNKGFVLEKLDDLEESTKCYDGVLSIDKHNKFALNNKAHNLRRKGDLENALDLINEVLDIDPNFTIAINNKTSILSSHGETEIALDFLESKLKEHQDSRILLQSKVNLLIDLLDLKEAMRVNDQILEMDSENINAINSKGVIYEHNSQYQNSEKYLPLAVEYFEKVVSKDKDFPLGWSNKIVCLIRSGLLTDAEDLIDTVANIFPTNSHILNEKGILLLEKRDLKKALKYFNKALKYDFLDKALINKARTLFLLHKHEETIKTTDKILKYDMTNSDAWRLKGDALKKLHQITRAKRCFEKAEEYKKEPRSLLE